MSRTFFGREKELKDLRDLFKMPGAVMAVCRGRRRIGKSTLIQEFSREADHFIEIQGLSPRENIGLREQLNTFSEQFAKQTEFPKLNLESWEQAFSLLSKAITDKKTIVFLDEISWLAKGDKDFAGKLKISWDTELKKHKNLILILCGSVSSWLESNILNNTGFVGRVSLDLKLEELDLSSCNLFWGKNRKSVSTYEKLKLLCVTGGVPRYLEEIRPELPAEENIQRLCFRQEGLLFTEFEHIFSSIFFSRRADIYKKILQSLVYGSRDIEEICTNIGIGKSGAISNYLNDLCEAGFVKKDTSFNLSRFNISRFAKYRLKDNYTRFYLRYIQEKKEIINTLSGFKTNLDTFIEWDIIRGFQFENLVLNNLSILFDILDIDPSVLQYSSPYFQKKTNKQDSCQIDLLIISKYSIYVCEVKFKKNISKSVIEDVIEKTRKLKIPNHLSIRPVLIYAGNIEQAIISEGYFFNIINIDRFLEVPF